MGGANQYAAMTRKLDMSTTPVWFKSARSQQSFDKEQPTPSQWLTKMVNSTKSNEQSVLRGFGLGSNVRVVNSGLLVRINARKWQCASVFKGFPSSLNKIRFVRPDSGARSLT